MRSLLAALWVVLVGGLCMGGVGDPQLRTDHPWYPGELAISTFDRLFRTQAELYTRVTGRPVVSDEDKALASWYWRNLHYAHGEDGKCDLFGQGFGKTEWNREYWTGLFAHGIGLCGTTHAQYTAEMNALLGHCRARCVGVAGHNSFEVYLTGGAYGAGRWALLDHDISTVVFAPDGSRLLSILEISRDLKNLANPEYLPQRQRGWRLSGLHPQDAPGVYTQFNTAEYLAGYAGPPPMVHLRRGESLRRYLAPGLEDGKTFVFWGMNYKAGGIPGPERSRTWVNQPEKMYRADRDAGHKPGQFRYGNAVYTYTPDFTDGSYREGLIEETPNELTFEFYSPYVIAATPASDKPWGIYDSGGTNGLLISAWASVPVAISTDQGRTWRDAGVIMPGQSLDATDLVKGHYQYWIRFYAGAATFRDAKLSWRTVCQCNPATIPHLKDGTNRITFMASNRAVLSAGPTKSQADAHAVEGTATTLRLTPPRGARPVHLYAASWNNSGNPPQAATYRIDYAAGDVKGSVVKDWTIVRREPEPKDFWSQSFCYGEAVLKDAMPGQAVEVTFSNSGRRSYRKVEAHLVYDVAARSAARVGFAWREKGGTMKRASREYAPSPDPDASWELETGEQTETVWVEIAAP